MQDSVKLKNEKKKKLDGLLGKKKKIINRDGE